MPEWDPYRAPSGPGAEPRRGRHEHFVAPPDEVEMLAADRIDESSQPTSIRADTWRRLRRNPLFIASSLLIVLIIVVAVFPGLFTGQDPRYCLLDNSMKPAGSGHPFGFDMLGCDIYARTVYGARASVAVGIGATVLFVLIGGTVGALAGFYGGVLDSVVSRLTEIVYALPLMLAAIVTMQVLSSRTIWTVIVILAAFSWPVAARIARGGVIEAKNSEYVTAAKALGVSRLKTLVSHVVPNAVGPLIVVATVSLGGFIAAEATLSYLGIGLPLPPTGVAWGGDIATGQQELRSGSPILFYPATALAITVLSFITMGDAISDALDPKAREG